ncbi:hypothetical protein R9C00_03185 [Flammeovirgaceae bacterium SG7u.111]|nr:hypothetical protein [Flammeovirgaceae bacterium SG7u.132]WPO36446.1 hypothetical protein R9C00_03185 [Flammeovirgaceae bacterium SG7u.111]
MSKNSTLPFRLIKLLTITLLLLVAGAISAQDQESKSDFLNVFVDCNHCDINFLRQEVDYLNYVRDRELADVHVLVNNQPNGSGGNSYELNFIGLKEFEGTSQILSYNTTANNTYDEVRSGLTKMIAVGMVPYISQTDLVDNLVVKVKDVEKKKKGKSSVPSGWNWNNWIFEVYGSGSLNQESSRKKVNLDYGTGADRITEDWRVTADLHFSYREQVIQGEDEVITTLRKRNSFFGRIARSVTDHWSAGMYSNIYMDSYRNIDMSSSFTPALEYSLFPYTEVMKREITVRYQVGLTRQQYIESTIYEKMAEDLMGQALVLSVRYRQPWGSVNGGVTASNYFHDFTKNRFSFNYNMNVRVVKGLSVRMSGYYNLIRDQLYLPQGEISTEDLLLSQTQVATDYEMGVSAGLAYNFGAMFNNTVNTRL